MILGACYSIFECGVDQLFSHLRNFLVSYHGVCEIGGHQFESLCVQDRVKSSNYLLGVLRDHLNLLARGCIASIFPEIFLVNYCQLFNNIDVVHNLREARDRYITARSLEWFIDGSSLKKLFTGVITESTDERHECLVDKAGGRH